MSIDIIKLAKQIANRLDESDKNGRNRKIDSDAWNIFVAGKGKRIIRYIEFNTAVKSIATYLRREANASKTSINDIGQRWLDSINNKTLTAELPEIVVTSKKALKPFTQVVKPSPEYTMERKDVTKLEVPAIQPRVELKNLAQAQAQENDVAKHNSTQDATQEAKPSEAKKETVASDIIPPSISESAQNDAASLEPVFTDIVQPIQPPVQASTVSVTDTEAVASMVESSVYKPDGTDYANKTADEIEAAERKFAEYKETIRQGIKDAQKHYKKYNLPESLISSMADTIAAVDKDNLYVSSIVNTIKHNHFAEIKARFHKNITEASKFILRVASYALMSIGYEPKQGGRDKIVSIARSYLDAKITSDREGNIYFSNGRRQAWCVDTAYTIIKEALGSNVPSDFKTSSVRNMQKWGIKHNAYKSTSTMRLRDRKDYIAQNVRPGDIMILRENYSHAGLVIEVAEDGSWFKTIEGNTSDALLEKIHYCYDEHLSGFISLDKFISPEKEIINTNEYNDKKDPLELC